MTPLKTDRINENTILIDIELFESPANGAVYVVHAEKTCLIDSGTPGEVPRLIETLKHLDLFPPDYIILTHAHFDHSQGVGLLREQAHKEGKPVDVLASEQAIPLLADQSFNKIFVPDMPFHNVTEVGVLQEGAIIDLGGYVLEVLHVPGHSNDHIALYDPTHKNIFVGDALGYNTLLF